jgi:tetratricopeptide (TPR) repeat protein
MSAPAPTEPLGTVVTFYSYKGGTGRTMALANVAWILASAGKRVLVADWDLEAPGLDRFLTPLLRFGPAANLPGVIDMVREYENAIGVPEFVPPAGWIAQQARVVPHVVPVDWDFPGEGRLDLLTAGRQNADYTVRLAGLDWDNFYENLGGATFFDALRADMRTHYDYALIDSRTGLSDVADICTQHLPDVLLDCYTLSNQSIDGAAKVAQAVSLSSRPGVPGRPVRILPVAMRVDLGEKDKAEAGRSYAQQMFDGLPAGMSEQERALYYAAVEVPYQTFYAYEETLATFFDTPGPPTTLLAAYERLTAVITDGAVTSMPAMDEPERERWQRRFRRSARPQRAPARIRYAAADQLWAEWVIGVLDAADIIAVDEGPLEIFDEPPADSSTALTIVSPDYLAARPSPEGSDPWLRSPHLALLVGEARMPARQSAFRSSIANVAPDVAVRRLLTLVGHVSDPSPDDVDASAVRFPGAEPRWIKAPARNARFTGRIEDLQTLRRQLQSGGRAAVVQPVALHGLGGVGKTQLAMEYVHRFRSDYDLVWWIDADPPQFVDAALIDLGARLDLITPSVTIEGAQATLDALRSGNPTRRWLLVYDNADDMAALRDLIPDEAAGHVLITSRNRDWDSRARAISIDVFRRAESVAHLRSRVPALTWDESDRVADALGDLPIAVAAAGAWLAETGVPVADYLASLRSGAGQPQLQGQPPVEVTWDLSLQRLREQSPGGHRLLQICSVVGSDIALDLLYSDGLMAAVAVVDPSAGERDMRATLVQSINRLALLKLDTQARQVQVHRLLQEVVRNRMDAHEQAATRHEVHLALAAFRPGEPDDPATWDRFRMIWRHLRISEAEKCNDESVRALLVDRVRYLWRRGDLESGRLLGMRVADQWDRLLARIESPDPGAEPVTDVAPVPLRRQLLLLRFNVANILRQQAAFQEALELDEQVLAGQTALLGEAHANTLMTMGGYAADLRALGRYGEALPMEERTNRAWRDLFGESHPRTLVSANNLAAALRAVGDFGAALAIDRDVYNRRRDLLGPTHPYTLHSQAAIARDLREAGEYEESVALLHTVYDLSSEHLGADALLTLDVQVSLAASLRGVGAADEAAGVLESAYGTLTHRFGAENPSTLACRLTRSGNLLTLGDVQTALVEMREVAKAYRTSLGEDHPFSLVCANNQAAALQRNGEPVEALRLAGLAAARFAEQLGTRHPHYLAAAMNEATSRFELGEVRAAASAMRETADLMEAALGPQHPDALLCRANLAVLAADGGWAVRGIGASAVDSAIEALADRLGPGHPSIAVLREGRLLYRVTDPQDPF